MTIGKLSPDMFTELKSLWHRVFGDDTEYINFFFREYGDEIEAMGVICDDKLCSMLLLLPMTVRMGEAKLDARYIYAVATDPEYRSKGLSGALLNETHRYLREQKIALSVLVPATESLFDYYGKRGYETAFSLDIKELEVESADTPDIDVAEGFFADLKAVRDDFFKESSCYAEYDAKALDYRFKECEFIGGKVLTFTVKNRRGYAVCFPLNKDTLLMKELCANYSKELVSSLAAYFGCRKVHVRTAGNNTPFAMSYWYTDKPPAPKTDIPAYMSLVLD